MFSRPTFALAALLLAVALPACSSDGDNAAPTPTVPPAMTVSATTARGVFPAGADGRIDQAGAAAVDHFIRAAAAGEPQAVHLSVRAPFNRAALERVGAIAVAQGVDPIKITYQTIDQPAGARRPAIEIVAERAIAVAPVCPSAPSASIIGVANPDGGNWGCAVISDLEAMVADPRDLITGEAGGRTDSALTSSAIDRLRTEKVHPLPDRTIRSDIGKGS